MSAPLPTPRTLSPPHPDHRALITSLFTLSSVRLLPSPLRAFARLRRLLPPASSHLLLRPIASLLRLSSSAAARPLLGFQLHSLSLSLGLAHHSLLLPPLLSLYSSHPSLLPSARSLAAAASPSLHPLPCNLLLSAYLRHGLPSDAIAAYKEFTSSSASAPPDNFTYSSVLRACAETRDLEMGKAVHESVRVDGMDGHLFVQNALVSMYAKCGEMGSARQVFDGMVERDVVSWNSMISAYASAREWGLAFELFGRMRAAGAEVDSVTWNTMVGGYIQMGDHKAAVELIGEMTRGGVKVDFVTLVVGLNACSRIGWLRYGKEIHGLAVRMGSDGVESVRNALITMYSRCKDMEHADLLFKTLPCPSVVTRNVMIAAFALSDSAEEASRLFREMVYNGLQPTYVTVVTYLALCARVANLQHGRELHTHIVKHGFEGYWLLWNSLVDMYSKSGRILVAQKVFNTMDDRGTISYTSMIAGYGMQGEGTTALELFDQMVDSGIKPDHISMVAVLSACSHSGLVPEGEQLFDKMVSSYGIMPQMEHYSCMVDLYARAGLLEKAEEMLNRTPFRPTPMMCAALVGACHAAGNTEIGERAAKRLLETRTENAGHYVLIANMYAAAGCWEELAMVRRLMRELGVRKSPGMAWVDLGKGFNPFLVGDKSNPLALEIYGILDELSEQIRTLGRCSDTDISSIEELTF